MSTPAKAQTSTATVTYLEMIRRALREEMERDASVFLIGEDIGAYGGAFKVTDGLLETFGADRVIDTPIAEAGIVGAAVGAALQGMRPVVEIQFIDFLANAYNQMVNMVAKRRWIHGTPVPIVVRGPCGGGVGAGPFHSQNPEVAYVHTPGLKVVAPATPADALGLLKSAIRDPDPVLFLEHKKLYRTQRCTAPLGEHLVPIGEAHIARPGRDLTILTYSAMVHVALAAAEQLAAAGEGEVEVVDLRTLSPLDRDTILDSVRRTSRVLCLHEDTRTLGMGAELTTLIAEEAFEYLDAPPARVTAPDTPVPVASRLEEAFIPDVAQVLETARRLLTF